MRIMLKSTIVFILSVFVMAAMAGHRPSLDAQRKDVIMQYVVLLGEGDYQRLPELFADDAMVVSSSGVSDTPKNFYTKLFTETLSMHERPATELIDILPGTMDKSRMSAYFTFEWSNDKGQRISAKFLDLFIFEAKTAKIKSLYVFGNTFQDDIMKQTGSHFNE